MKKGAGENRCGLFEIYFSSASNVRIGKSVCNMGGRRVIHFGPSTFRLQSSVGFGPRRKTRLFLGPMNQGGFIAPVN
jgi:hypothetical protein